MAHRQFSLCFICSRFSPRTYLRPLVPGRSGSTEHLQAIRFQTQVPIKSEICCAVKKLTEKSLELHTSHKLRVYKLITTLFPLSTPGYLWRETFFFPLIDRSMTQRSRRSDLYECLPFIPVRSILRVECRVSCRSVHAVNILTFYGSRTTQSALGNLISNAKVVVLWRCRSLGLR